MHVQPVTCPVCGIELPSSDRGRPRTYCSRRRVRWPMSCTCESDEGYCSLHGPSLQQQRIDAFPSIFG